MTALLDRKEVLYNFSWRALQLGARQGAAFLIFFIAAYYVAPEELGMFVYVLAVMQLIIIFCDFGFSSSATRYVAEHSAKGSGDAGTILYSVSAVVAGISVVVSLVIILAGRDLLENYILFLYFLPFLLLSPLSSVAGGVYTGLKKFRKLSIIGVVAAGVSVPLSFFLITLFGIPGAIASHNLLFFLLTVGLFVLLREAKFGIDFSIARKIVKYGVLIGLANVAYFLYTNVDIIILKHFNYVTEIAYYEIVNKIFRVLFIPAAILGQVIAPDITRSITRGQERKVYRTIYTILPKFLAVGIALSIVLYFVFPQILTLYFPEYYTDAFQLIFTILLIVLPFKLWGVFLTVGFITPGGFVKIVTITTFIGGILNVILDIVLITWLGFIGVFLATLIVHSLSIISVTVWFGVRLKQRIHGAI